MIVLHASFPLDPERRDEALDLIEDLVEQSRQEEGVIEYRATTDVDDPSVVRFFERYEDEAAERAHAESEHFGAFEAELPDLLAGDPEVLRFETDGVTEVDL